MIGNRIYRTPMVWLSTGLLSLGQAAMARGEAQRPNILFFLVDDMGWQDTSLPFGPEKTRLNELYRTPHMERLAAKGVKFTHAYACSISSPSRVSLFTGANVVQHRVSNWTLHKDTPTTVPAMCLISGSGIITGFVRWRVWGILSMPSACLRYCGRTDIRP